MTIDPAAIEARVKQFHSDCVAELLDRLASKHGIRENEWWIIACISPHFRQVHIDIIALLAEVRRLTDDAAEKNAVIRSQSERIEELQRKAHP